MVEGSIPAQQTLSGEELQEQTSIHASAARLFPQTSVCVAVTADNTPSFHLGVAGGRELSQGGGQGGAATSEPAHREGLLASKSLAAQHRPQL